ncbi:MAG: ABC transporter ATP-binding protein [Bacillota bacterium]|jgi:ATP-binding cassette subfamily B multidrug efflux pump
MSKQTSKKRQKGPFGGPGSANISGEKAKDFMGTLKKLLSFMGHYKASVILVIIFCIAGTVFFVVGPRILGNATTHIFEGIVSQLSGGPGIDFTSLGKTLLFLLVLYAISSLLNFFEGYIMSNVSQTMVYDLRDKFSKKINRLPMSYFDKQTYGEVLSRVTNDIDLLGQSLNQSMSQLIAAVTMIAGIIVMMFSMNILLAVVVFAILPISVLAMRFIMKRSQRHFNDQQKYLGHINGHIEEVFAGQNIVKVFNNEKKVAEKFDNLNDTLYSSSWKSQFFGGIMMPLMMFIGNLAYVAIAILGAWLVIQGTIAVGVIQAFIQYVRNFSQPISQVAQGFALLQSTAAAAERVFEFLEEAEEIPSTKNPLPTDNISGKVDFKNVHFGYSEDKIVINDFSAHIKAGQKVAIVGPTGAGKSTMVKLLMRFYDINSGAIEIDGHDIKDFNRNDLRNLFGMVLQDTWLFHGSIMENIRYGNLNATDEQVIEAAKAAYVDHFVRTLPDGYNMELNEEANNVSQGQKQLLTIARAILADPKILILDEATSSVDTRTELRIQKAMDNLMHGRTSFIIAHRLSTIKDADLILVMDQGDIVEQGNHQELLTKNGLYANLYNSQFESMVG